MASKSVIVVNETNDEEEKEKYNMNHKERGTALVINMRNYEVKLKERVWSEKDVEELTKALA